MASKSGEEAQEKMQKALLDVINDIDKSHLRKIQLLMHRCAAKCCENTVPSLEETQGCVDKCAKDVRNAQNFVAQEIGHFQSSLQTCVMECEDAVKSDDLTQSQYKEGFDRCAVKCFDDHRINLLPSLLNRLKISLDSVVKK